MKKLLIAAALLGVSSPAMAETTSEAAMKWEYAYLGLSAIDAVQTVVCLNSGRCEEANPLFGKNPSTAKVVIAKVAGSALQFAIFNEVRKRDPKMALRVAQVSVAVQGTAVVLNARFAF